MSKKIPDAKINVTTRAGSTTQINLVHDESGDILDEVTGSSLPVPNLDDLVNIHRTEIEEDGSESTESGDLYRVVDSQIVYSEVTKDGETTTTAIVNLYVLPRDEYEELEPESA